MTYKNIARRINDLETCGQYVTDIARDGLCLYILFDDADGKPQRELVFTAPDEGTALAQQRLAVRLWLGDVD